MPHKPTPQTRHEYEAEFPIAARRACLAASDAHAEVEATAKLRLLMDIIGMPAVCELVRCRRADACNARKVDCAFVHAPWLERTLFADLDQYWRAERRTAKRTRAKRKGRARRVATARSCGGVLSGR